MFRLSGSAADLEWRLTYVGDAESESDDQVLDSVLVGPVYPGQYRFVFQVHPPLTIAGVCSTLVLRRPVREAYECWLSE